MISTYIMFIVCQMLIILCKLCYKLNDKIIYIIIINLLPLYLIINKIQ